MKALVEKLIFALTCLYLLSQAFLVPLLSVGPSWAIWPTLTDIVVAVMVPLLLLDGSWKPQASEPIRSLWNFGALVTIGCIVSYFILTIYALKLEVGLVERNGKSVAFGAAQLYRMLQALVVFRAVTSFNLTSMRLAALKSISILLFLLICAGVLVTYTGVLPTQALALGMSTDSNVAGPWAFYSSGSVDQGVGTISYNHAYTAMQVLLSGALCLALNARTGRSRVVAAAVPLMMIVGCFISGSRMGFLAAIVFAICASGLRLQSVYVWLSVSMIVIVLAIAGVDTFSPFQEAAERQSTSANSFGEDGLNGRTELWSDRMNFMNSEPRHWLVGAGFGSVIETGNNAHNLFLQLLIEGGVLAVALFTCLQYRLITLLIRQGTSARPLLWVTVALLITCLTQETFYPVPAFPHFLAFFSSAIALSVTESALSVKYLVVPTAQISESMPCLQ